MLCGVAQKKYKAYLWPVFRINIHVTMFEFQQYLGFLLFLTIATIGFWLMMFLVSIVFYWIGGASLELWKEKRAAAAKK